MLSGFCICTPKCVHLRTKVHTYITLMPPQKMPAPLSNQRQSWERKGGLANPRTWFRVGLFWPGDSEHSERSSVQGSLLKSASQSSGWHFGNLDLLRVLCLDTTEASSELDFCPKQKLRSLLKRLFKKPSINLNWLLSGNLKFSFIYLFLCVCIMGGAHAVA